MKKSQRIATCSVDFAFQRIGGKHKGRIIWHLKEKILRYGELKKAISGITPKMLTQTLRELEDDGLITRKVFLEVPPKVEYTITENGKDLVPFIEMLKTWGQSQMQKLGIEEIH
jgi:DNA-binding HxlR family transcriptional regulator